MSAYDAVNILSLVAFCVLRCGMELVYTNPKAMWNKLRGLE